MLAFRHPLKIMALGHNVQVFQKTEKVNQIVYLTYGSFPRYCSSTTLLAFFPFPLGRVPAVSRLQAGRTGIKM